MNIFNDAKKKKRKKKIEEFNRELAVVRVEKYIREQCIPPMGLDSNVSNLWDFFLLLITLKHIHTKEDEKQKHFGSNNIRIST